MKDPTACTQEKELNNEPGTANELVDSVCGTLLPASELDYLTFTLPEKAKSMNLTYEGNVKLRISVEGFDPVELSSSNNPQVPFAPGKQYIIRVSADGGGAVKIDWRVNVVHT